MRTSSVNSNLVFSGHMDSRMSRLYKGSDGKRVKIFCPNCSVSPEYDEKFDSYFCKEDNIWLEPKCSEVDIHEDCWFSCWERPDTPTQV